MKRRKNPIIIAGIILVLSLIAAGIFALIANSSERRLAEQLDLGQKYLDELDYEQAIVAYEAVLEIDPKCEEAYLALADIYVVLGDIEKAVEILGEGYSQTSSETILERQKEIFEQAEREEGALLEDNQEPETQASEGNQSGSGEGVFVNEVNGNEISEDTLKNILLENVDQPIINFIYDDFDNNGVYEAVAFCGEYDEFDGSCFGTLYFVSQEGVQVIREKDGYWDSGKVYDFDNSKIIAITVYFTTCGLTYYYQVNGYDVVEIEGSGYGAGLYQDEQGRMYMPDSQYDGSVDGTGHTWNIYYFYWENGLKEYGGTEISVDEFMAYSGANEIIKKIEDDGYEITPIYKRKNGIINVNCCDGWNNANVRMVYDDVSVELLPVTEGFYYEAGIIYPALIPEIATY